MHYQETGTNPFGQSLSFFLELVPAQIGNIFVQYNMVRCLNEVHFRGKGTLEKPFESQKRGRLPPTCDMHCWSLTRVICFRLVQCDSSKCSLP